MIGRVLLTIISFSITSTLFGQQCDWIDIGNSTTNASYQWQYSTSAGLIFQYCINNADDYTVIQGPGWSYTWPSSIACNCTNGNNGLAHLLIKGDTLLSAKTSYSECSTNLGWTFKKFNPATGEEYSSVTGVEGITLNSKIWYSYSSHVFFGSSGNTLLCFDPWSDELKWQIPLSMPSSSNVYLWHDETDGVYFIAIRGSGENTMDYYRIDKATGEVLFSFSSGQNLHSQDEIMFIQEELETICFVNYEGVVERKDFDFEIIEELGQVFSYNSQFGDNAQSTFVERDGLLFQLTSDPISFFGEDFSYDEVYYGSLLKVYDSNSFELLESCGYSTSDPLYPPEIIRLDNSGLGIVSTDSWAHAVIGYDVGGCIDPTACNYDVFATEDDGSCDYGPYPYDCDLNCLNDLDGNGICDEFESGPSFNPDANGDGVIDVTDLLSIIPLFGMPFEAEPCIGPD